MSTDPHGQHNQPLPKPNDNPSSHDLLIEDIKERKAFGLKKYGQPLRAHNGRDTLLDAYEEILDLAVYLRTLRSERETVAVKGCWAASVDGEVSPRTVSDTEIGAIVNALCTFYEVPVPHGVSDSKLREIWASRKDHERIKLVKVSVQVVE